MATKLRWCAFSVIQILGTIAVMSQVAWQVFAIFIPVTAVCIWYQSLCGGKGRKMKVYEMTWWYGRQGAKL
ncbi:hypothetical protein AAHE18_19G195000 [Arachis hypogaea]